MARIEALRRKDGWGPDSDMSMHASRNKAYSDSVGRLTRRFSTLSKDDRRFLAVSPRLRVWTAWGGGFPIKVDGEIVGAIGTERAAGHGCTDDIGTARAREQP